ncbi:MULTISPECIES: phosphopantetheine-binding protein [unclassified Streptomyces]|uniref:phosphopantetheine-binding protein n=1 Tax=unclassified Streptomyces TaxID=2593676 RepID=UPI002033BD4B|nr:phosphopantetheine-binding protein [Streptomyces sp. RKAG290]MCM2413326.1 phosphopantetheine-binding protein [Streptomyces sp. RKAG290]
MLIATDITALIHQEINALLLEAGRPVHASLSGAEFLHELGLNSLLLARLIIQLETELGADPFEEEYVISDVRTVGALSEAYIRTVENMAAAAL